MLYRSGTLLHLHVSVNLAGDRFINLQVLVLVLGPQVLVLALEPYKSFKTTLVTPHARGELDWGSFQRQVDFVQTCASSHFNKSTTRDGQTRKMNDTAVPTTVVVTGEGPEFCR